MHIQDFHSKLPTHEGPLFDALRGLSRFEDPKELFDIDGNPARLCEWQQWPGMDEQQCPSMGEPASYVLKEVAHVSGTDAKSL